MNGNNEKLKTFLSLDELANEAGRQAAASLSIYASTMARKAVYEQARRDAYNKGMREAGHEEPLKGGDELIRKMKFGR